MRLALLLLLLTGCALPRSSYDYRSDAYEDEDPPEHPAVAPKRDEEPEAEAPAKRSRSDIDLMDLQDEPLDGQGIPIRRGP